MIKVYVDGVEIDTEITKHSDGALNLKIDHTALESTKNIACLYIPPTLDVSTATVLIEMASIIFDTYVPFYAKLALNIPYFPYARADRQFQDGMSIPLKMFCNSLSAQNWDVVYAKDVHNEQVTKKWCNKLKVQSQRECFDETVNNNVLLQQLLKSDNIAFCAPDKGASLKVSSVANGYSDNIIQLNKCRDIETGRITGIDIVSGDVKGKDVIIVDDICDGGFTFSGAAEELKYNGAKSVSLYVTHGIFDQRFKLFEMMVDYIFANQIVGNYVTMCEIGAFNNV